MGQIHAGAADALRFAPCGAPTGNRADAPRGDGHGFAAPFVSANGKLNGSDESTRLSILSIFRSGNLASSFKP